MRIVQPALAKQSRRMCGLPLILAAALLIPVACGPPPTPGTDMTSQEEAMLKARLSKTFPVSPGVTNLTLSALESSHTVFAELDGYIRSRSGKKIVIEVGGTWCPGCITEYPALVRFAQERPGIAVALLALEKELDKGIVLDGLIFFFHSGDAVLFPSYIVMDEAGKPMQGQMLSSLVAVESLLEKAPESEHGHGTRVNMEDLLGKKCEQQIKINSTESLDVHTGLSEVCAYFEAIADQASVELYCAGDLEGREVHLSMELPACLAMRHVCDMAGCKVTGVSPFGTGEPPLIVVKAR